MLRGPAGKKREFVGLLVVPSEQRLHHSCSCRIVGQTILTDGIGEHLDRRAIEGRADLLEIILVDCVQDATSGRSGFLNRRAGGHAVVTSHGEDRYRSIGMPNR